MRDDPTAEALSTWLADLPGRGALPFDAEPKRLYTVGGLYRGYSPADPASLKATLDARIYDWTFDTAAQALPREQRAPQRHLLVLAALGRRQLGEERLLGRHRLKDMLLAWTTARRANRNGAAE